MRRSFWSRVLAGWLACWLPLVLADGGWLHACPMHGFAVRDGAGMVAPAAAHAAAMPGMVPLARSSTAMAKAGHDVHAAHHGSHPAGHACTCLGACCAAVAVLPVRPAPVTLAVVERASVAPTGRPEHEYVAAWVDFVLPFATAPPAQG